MSDEQDKEFVEFIIKGIVNNPDQVKVDRTVDEMGVLLTVKVSAEDMGIVIGRKGETAKSIRSLARIRGMRNNARVNIRIIEPDGSTRMSGPGGQGSSSAPSSSMPTTTEQSQKSTASMGEDRTGSIDDIVNNLGV